MQNQQILELFIQPEQQGTYFTLPFAMPADTEEFTLQYSYDRHHAEKNGAFATRKEINIVDLGLFAPDGAQVGVSGSDKHTITINENQATPGYKPHALVPGEWRILVGAYKVAPEGMKVTYELTFTPKQRRLLKGDLHTHTLASDGVLTVENLAQRAHLHGLDFLAITDHNQTISADALPHIPGLTLIPGMEWTHFRGHANFLGIEKIQHAPFAVNTPEEVMSSFQAARDCGALISINHPFDVPCDFRFDLNTLPYDCLEIWNGPMRESNLKALAFWQSQLAAGKRIAICGGSDYHRDSPFLFPGGPTTCIFSASAGRDDLLAALRQGHAYVIFAPNGPALEMTAGEAILGDRVGWNSTRELTIQVENLLAGDVLRVITAQEEVTLFEAPSAGQFEGVYPMSAPGFARVEVLRSFLPGIPKLPALISNPIYFE